MFKEGVKFIFFKLFQKSDERMLEIHFKRPALLWHKNPTDTIKKKLPTNDPDEYRLKNPQQNISKPHAVIHLKAHSSW